MGEGRTCAIRMEDEQKNLLSFSEVRDCIFRYGLDCGWSFQSFGPYAKMNEWGLHGCYDVRKAGKCRYWDGREGVR